MPRGLWIKCEQCGESLFDAELEENLRVCTACKFHLRLPTASRLSLVLDEDSFVECDAGMKSTDPLEFHIDNKKYKDSLKKAELSSGPADAFLAGLFELFLEGRPVSLAEEAADTDLNEDSGDRERQGYLPHVLILSSGEVTPFQLRLVRWADRSEVLMEMTLNGEFEINADETAAL